MFKKLLSCLALAALASALNAQIQVLKTSDKEIQSINGLNFSKKASAPMKITPTDGQKWWGYYDGSELLRGIGMVSEETYDCAIFVPNKGIFKGAIISAVRFVLQDDAAYANVRAWASAIQPKTSSDWAAKSDVIKKPIGKSDGYNEVEFLQSYTITGDGAYIGISFDIKDITTEGSKYPLMVTSEKTDNALFFRSSINAPEWVDFKNYGELALQILMETPNTQENSVAIVSSPELTTLADSNQTMNLYLINKGTAGIKSIDYDVTFGDKLQSHHYELATPFSTINGKTTIQVPVKTPSEVAFLQPTVKISKVNGANNEEKTENTSICPLINIKNSAPHKSVMEEFTGTWCGYCPRGVVGMRNLKNIFGEKFIGIAVHASTLGVTDPMATSTYDSISHSVTGFPTSFIDRVIETDPYYGLQNEEVKFHADTVFNRILNMPSEVELGLKSSWKDDNTIDLTTTVNYYYSRTDNPYRLAYVIIEDSLSGTTALWTQANSYKGSQTVDSDMSEFVNGASMLKGFKFNHVAHAIYDAMGIENSLIGALEMGKTTTHNYQIDITKFSCPVQNRQNVKAIAMVINSNTGRIINAQEVKIGGENGLSNMRNETLTANVTNINGLMSITTNIGETTNVSIYKADGSLVVSKNFSGSTNIITSGMKGAYIVRVSHDKGVSVRRIIL